jgi:hypothetical protein
LVNPSFEYSIRAGEQVMTFTEGAQLPELLPSWSYERVLQLLERAAVAVDHGRLVILPNSGESVPESWFSDNHRAILTVISRAMDVSIYLYQGYTTKSGKYSGVELTFWDIRNDTYPLAYFNACLKRQRNTKNAKAGELLPKGHFSIFINMGKRPPAFYQFWQRTGLKQPKRLSTYHEKMGQLSSIVFTANTTKTSAIDRKIINETLSPLCLSYQAIFAAFNNVGASASTSSSRQKAFDNSPAMSRQSDDNLSTTDRQAHSTTKSNDTSQAVASGHFNSQAFKPQNTEHSYTETQNNSMDTRRSNREVMPFNAGGGRCVEEQTIDEWLDDYNSA